MLKGTERKGEGRKVVREGGKGSGIHNREGGDEKRKAMVVEGSWRKITGNRLMDPSTLLLRAVTSITASGEELGCVGPCNQVAPGGQASNRAFPPSRR